MDKKYELTDNSVILNNSTLFDNKKLYRIRALKDFDNVHIGQIGGWVESEKNLSQDGDCWIYDDGIVCDDAVVKDNAKVLDSAIVMDSAIICDNAIIYDYGEITEEVKIKGNAKINQIVYGNIEIDYDVNETNIDKYIEE